MLVAQLSLSLDCLSLAKCVSHSNACGRQGVSITGLPGDNGEVSPIGMRGPAQVSFNYTAWVQPGLSPKTMLGFRRESFLLE